MAIAFGNLQATTYASRTNTTVTAPTGISNGDTLVTVLFLLSSNNTTPTAATLPSGFVSAADDMTGVATAPNGGNAWRLQVAKKKAASESGNYTWTHASRSSQAAIARYSGSNGTVNVWSATSSNASNTTRTAGGVTTTQPNCMMLYIGFDWADNTNNETPPTGFTERYDDVLLYWADAIQASAGASGDKTNTCNSSSTAPRGAFLIALEEDGGSGISGTASITEAADSVASTGTLAIKGSAGITEAADTLSSSGKVALTGSASITEAADTVSSAGKVSITGAASITEAADTATATGTLAISGQASITEGADTLSATGESTVTGSGSASITEDADTVSASATLAIKGQASLTEAGDTLAGTGTLPITGASSITEGADTLSATANLAIVGSASITEEADTVEATGALAAALQDAPDWAASANVHATTSSTNSTPAIPTSSAGDLLFLSAGCIASNTAFTVTKSGADEWNEIWQGNVGANRAGFWWKRREASESAPTVTNSGRTSTNLLTSSIDAYTGIIASGTPIRNTQTVVQNSGAMLGAELVTEGRNSLAVTRFMRMGANSATAPDLLWTEDRDNGTSGGGGARYYGDSQVIEFPSTVPAVSRGGSSINYASVTFELIGQNTDPAAPSRVWKRGMWVWDFANVVGTSGARKTLIAACDTYKITDLYCYTFNTFVAANRSRIQAFIQAATDSGIRVWGLDGAREYFADADGRAGLEASLQAVIDHNAASGASQRFYGFHIDCEPADSGSYTTFHNGIASSALNASSGGVWQATQALDREYLMRDWVDMHEDILAVCHANGLQFATALPTWFDDYFGEPVECTYDGVTQNVFLHIAARSDVISIMSYNTDPKNVISRTLYEFLGTGSAEIGFSAETHSGVGSGVSYADTAGKNTTTALFADLDILRNRFHGYPNVFFDNIHDWEGFKAFAAIEDLPDDPESGQQPGGFLPTILVDRHGRPISLKKKANEVITKARVVAKELPVEAKQDAKEAIRDLAASVTAQHVHELQEALSGADRVLDRIMAELARLAEEAEDEDDTEMLLLAS